MDESLNIAPYKQLYETLRKHILDNIYPEGSILPSENELSKIHNLTRPTVRRALDTLVNEGYIIKQQGKGSIVSRKPRLIGIMSIEGVTSAVKDKSLKTVIITKPMVKQWPDNFSYELTDLEKESGCIFLERLRLVDDKPVFYDRNYIPNIGFPRFTQRNFENKSLFDVLRSVYQIEIKGGEQLLRALPANGKTAEYLQIKTNTPILHLGRKLTTNKPGLFIYSSLYCNTDEYRLHGVF